MKKLLSGATLSAFMVIAGSALADEAMRLTDTQMDSVTAAGIGDLQPQPVQSQSGINAAVGANDVSAKSTAYATVSANGDIDLVGSLKLLATPTLAGGSVSADIHSLGPSSIAMTAGSNISSQ